MRDPREPPAMQAATVRARPGIRGARRASRLHFLVVAAMYANEADGRELPPARWSPNPYGPRPCARAPLRIHYENPAEKSVICGHAVTGFGVGQVTEWPLLQGQCRCSPGCTPACHAEGRGFESLQPLSESPAIAGFFDVIAHVSSRKWKRFWPVLLITPLNPGRRADAHRPSSSSSFRRSRFWSNSPPSTGENPLASPRCRRVTWRLGARSAGSSANRISVQTASSSM